MWPYELMLRDVGSCPECGCGDVERMGRRGNHYRYACFEGHEFEVPKPQGPLRRLLRRRGHDGTPDQVGAQGGGERR